MQERLEFSTDRENQRRKRQFRQRLIVAFVFTASLFLFLIGRMAYLQWFNYERYHGLAEGNRISIEVLPPTRGKIYDRNHVLIADNQPVFAIKMIREDMDDIDLFEEDLKSILSDYPTERLDKFFDKFRKGRRAKTYTLPYTLNEQEAARFAVISHKHPGVTLSSRLKRTYPFKDIGVHAIGYVGRINQKELQKLDEKRYRGTEIIGKSGIEKYYENILHGYPGVQQVETNVRGSVLRKLETTPAISGQDIHLTLDITLQEFAEKLMGERRGSIVAIDPQSGEILAYVSTPTFDPNLFVDGIDAKTYRQLLNDPNRPFINRAINGQYPPGSTIKPFVALGAIENDYITPTKKVYDPGYFEYKGHRYRDWKRWGHGLVDMHKAIAQSCDTYFYELSLDMGIDAIHDAMAPFGFGERSGVDIPGESKGILPSQEWKRAVKGKPWYRGETIISSIGQGYHLSTPLQLARATAILANRGKQITPHLLQKMQDEFDAPMQIEIKKIENWEKVIQGMVAVMHGKTGTARRYGADLPFTMAGKTGTAQVFSLNEADYDAAKLDKSLHDHSLFVGFAPVERPRIAVAVIAENSGSGSKTAAPIAVNVIKRYLRPDLPLTPIPAEAGYDR
ncbi:penicillin-binding protein 2 [Thiomicrorhabdus xiamenensis]|uniref:Peptidoglycan D,D-transpeptidase MrdA n=1 Tax=Thiomicrorhabdus xiamenensis TaxID=2739063 RepID=A0A7D4P5H1_9GAMM|nr:penicillin-binding protein 2 [Thiomicrorhabdus xiamenensis]QKI89675.1 penicillin-binding protein 2 [Thiomicrorhabdus xiamenensis]